MENTATTLVALFSIEPILCSLFTFIRSRPTQSNHWNLRFSSLSITGCKLYQNFHSPYIIIANDNLLKSNSTVRIPQPLPVFVKVATFQHKVRKFRIVLQKKIDFIVTWVIILLQISINKDLAAYFSIAPQVLIFSSRMPDFQQHIPQITNITFNTFIS